jgi:hypothetical protein
VPTAILSGPDDRPLSRAATSPAWASTAGTLAGNDRQGDLGRPIDRSSPQPALRRWCLFLVMHVRVRMALLLPLMACGRGWGSPAGSPGMLMPVMLVVPADLQPNTGHQQTGS